MEHDHHKLLAYMQDPLSLLLNQENQMSGEASQKLCGQSTARQTRRRTSPEDQAILEAAYQQNSKPDKSVRLQLCHKVAMGEKEISVNLLPNHYVSFTDCNPPADLVPKQAQSSTESVNARVEICTQKTSLDNQSSTLNTSQSTVGSEHETKPAEGNQVVSSLKTQGKQHDVCSVYKDESQQPTPNQSSSDSSKNKKSENEDSLLLPVIHHAGGYNTQPLPEKMSLPLNKSQESIFTLHDEAQALSSDTTHSLPASLKRTLSQPRLCTSLDGFVRVKTGLSPTPSPPRAESTANGRQARMTGPLQRSQSAMLPSTSSSFGSCSSFGRSRDSRTWEFFCDSASRNELTRAAELEQTGSAAGAIALMRSASANTTSTAATTSNKRSSPASRKLDSQKRIKAAAETTSKPKLARPSSSVARLQTNTNASNIAKPTGSCIKSLNSTNSDNNPKKKTYAIDIYPDGNDSDKENWVPGTQVSAPARRSRKSRASPHSKILRENTYLSSQPTSLIPHNNQGMGRHGNRLGPKQEPESEDSDDDDDEEVTRFMGRRGSSGLVLGRAGDEEDMAGVHGLLSLSQGAWR
ncbi:MAG: hypothetical protein Q9184_001536 [Pyrenodesmia sp. 2 TL-2023]